jgi:hypothetical protein
MQLINPNPTTSVSQRLQILRALEAGKELTSITMLTHFGAYDGRKRISELRALGYPIKDKRGYNERTKKYYNIYYMVGTPEAGPV